MTQALAHDLQGKSILITGASTGIGAAAARAFAACGCKVGIHYNASRNRAEEVAADVRLAGGQAHLVGGDFTDSAAVRRVIDEAAGALGGIDVLVNNAGGLVRRVPISEVDDAFLMLEAVARGKFLAFVPKSVARDALTTKRVKAVATLENGTAAVGARVVLDSCTDSTSRRWYEYKRAGTSTPMLVNMHSRLCLARDGSNNLVQAQCDGGVDQRYATIATAAWFDGDLLKSDDRCLTRSSTSAQPFMSTSCTEVASRRWFKDF